MIRAAVTGGSLPVAGEIIKILINHPDVELAWVAEPDAEGALLSSIHKGLRGETYMRFCAEPDFDSADILFLCSDIPGQSAHFLASNEIPERIKIVDVSSDMLRSSTFADGDEWIFGLPELSRKPLVRGATKATVPPALTSAVLLSLLPLVKNKVATSDIHVHAVVAETDAEPGEALALIDLEDSDDILRALQSLDPEFNAHLTFMVICGGWHRGISLSLHTRVNCSEEEALAMFSDFYSDHSFTFLSESLPNLTEVAGTNKCIINVQKVGDRLVVNTVIDDIIKGAAAMAVHDMNLLFGLQERVGLMLKAHS